MGTPERSRVIRLGDAQAKIPGPAGEHALNLMRRGTLDLRLSVGRFAPRPNQQTPHAQDELYLVVRGSGVLFHDGKREHFESGDVMFVAAGVEHHFADFSEDLVVWVVFYGRQGGEVPVS